MDEFFQIAVFGTACYVLSLITRRGFEAVFTCLKRAPGDFKKPYPNASSRIWNDLVLYAIPPTWGAVLALLIRKTTLFPESFRAWQVALVFGIAFGFLSGFLYKLMKQLIAKSTGVVVIDEPVSAPTPPSTGPVP
jgi:hypothetical protein